jgi:hypothetical protein
MLAAYPHNSVVGHGIGRASPGDRNWLVAGLSVVREHAGATRFLDQCVGCSVGLLDFIFGRGSVTITRLRLQPEQRLQVLHGIFVRRSQQRCRFIVTLASGVLTEATAADNVCSGNASVYAQGYIGVGDFIVFVCKVSNRLRRCDELVRLVQSPLGDRR